MDDLYPGWDGLAESTQRVQEWVVEPLLRRPGALPAVGLGGQEYAEWQRRRR